MPTTRAQARRSAQQPAIQSIEARNGMYAVTETCFGPNGWEWDFWHHGLRHYMENVQFAIKPRVIEMRASRENGDLYPFWIKLTIAVNIPDQVIDFDDLPESVMFALNGLNDEGERSPGGGTYDKVVTEEIGAVWDILRMSDEQFERYQNPHKARCSIEIYKFDPLFLAVEERELFGYL